jgi:predicted  nucleic acid-binding Zn-ribbon protein
MRERAMSYLYEQPFKDQLRREIAEMKRESWNERKEHMKTRQLLRIARAKIEALESRIEGMKQTLQSAIAEADHDIGPAVVERYRKNFQIEFDEAATG